MKKIFVLFALMLMTCISAFAQSSLIATLSHDGQIRAFYGGNALSQAHQAAVAGDIITLTGGSFSSITITKAITLRGAGMVGDPEAQTFPTQISGTCYIEVTDTIHRLVIEGINFLNNVTLNKSLYRPYFQKCKFVRVTGQPLIFASFMNCHIQTGIDVRNSGITAVNSYINNPAYSGNNNVYEFLNCVLNVTSSSYSYGWIYNSTISNSIFVQNVNYGSLANSNTVYNCIATGNSVGNFFQNFNVGNNKVVSDISKVFKVFTGNNYVVDISFELTDEAATTYLGTDGTQVGMYGGPLPFDPKISTLVISKCNVASKSTVDGKLSVEIEVSGVE